MASFAITDSSNIIGSVRIMVQEEGLLAPQGWTCWQFPFLFQASLKARSYFYKWAGIGFPVSSMLSSESEESYQTLCLLLSGEAVKYFFFFFLTLKGLPWHILDHQIPTNFTDVVGPLNFTGLILPWRACYLTKAFDVLTTPCSFSSSNIMS